MKRAIKARDDLVEVFTAEFAAVCAEHAAAFSRTSATLCLVTALIERVSAMLEGFNSVMDCSKGHLAREEEGDVDLLSATHPR